MTRNGLYVVAGALMFGTSALHASRTGAQTQQQIDWCNNDGNVFSVDQRLSGCTAVVESERASAQDRAAGYGNRCWAYSDKSTAPKLVYEEGSLVKRSRGAHYCLIGIRRRTPSKRRYLQIHIRRLRTTRRFGCDGPRWRRL